MSESLLATTRKVFRDRGPKAVAVLAFKKIVSPFAKGGSMYFLERDLSAAMPRIQHVDGIIAREGTLADLPLLKTFDDPERARQETIERLQRGDHWFLGIEESTGRLANYRWVSVSSSYIPELNRDLVVKPGQAYIYHLETLPEFRRRGIEAVTRQFTYTVLHQKYGIERIVAYIRADNHASLQAARQYLTPITRVWFMCTQGRVYMFARRHPRMPELRQVSPAQHHAAALARTSSSLR